METQSLKSQEDQPPPYAVATAPSGTSSWEPPPTYYSHSIPPSPPNNYVPSYGSTHSTIIMPEIILVGGCPACRIGIVEDDYTCLGLLCAILFFPFGILCCLLLKQRRCSHCGAFFA